MTEDGPDVQQLRVFGMFAHTYVALVRHGKTRFALAWRNPGSALPTARPTPDYATLHPGYKPAAACISTYRNAIESSFECDRIGNWSPAMHPRSKPCSA
jgi:hypothetical protein